VSGAERSTRGTGGVKPLHEINDNIPDENHRTVEVHAAPQEIDNLVEHGFLMRRNVFPGEIPYPTWPAFTASQAG
jgi:hypothetical protein